LVGVLSTVRPGVVVGVGGGVVTVVVWFVVCVAGGGVVAGGLAVVLGCDVLVECRWERMVRAPLWVPAWSRPPL
jgi:hypothetical protein